MPGGLTGSHESLLQGTNILLTLLVLMASLKSAVVRPGVFPLAPLCWCLLSNSLWVRDKGCLSVPNPSFTHNTRSGKTVVQLLIVQACWSVTVLVQHLSAVAGVNPWRSFGYFHRRVCCQAYLDRSVPPLYAPVLCSKVLNRLKTPWLEAVQRLCCWRE